MDISHVNHGSYVLHIVREGGVLEAIARKFDPVLKTYFLHTSCTKLRAVRNSEKLVIPEVCNRLFWSFLTRVLTLNLGPIRITLGMVGKGDSPMESDTQC
jgi:hypothetical protein